MLFRLTTLVLVATLTLPAVARLTFTQRLQKKASVTLRQDKTIDLLVNGREPEVTENKQHSAPVAPAHNVTPAKPSTTAVKKPEAAQSTAPKTQPTTPLTPSATTSTAITVHPAVAAPTTTYTTAQGYRVKVYMGGSTRQDKETAQNVGKEFKNLFPNVSVYMHFVSPHWICTAGDFYTYVEAMAFIKKVKESGKFNAAGMTVVKSKIKVPVK